jgi:hypothetical protein
VCDAHPSFPILPILSLVLGNGELSQSSVLNFLLVKSGLLKTQSIDFSLKSPKSLTLHGFDQFFIENSMAVVCLGSYIGCAAYVSSGGLYMGQRESATCRVCVFDVRVPRTLYELYDGNRFADS